MADEKFIKLICKVCGGPLEFDGSVYTCQACGAKFQDGRTKSQNDILLVSAFDDLRKGEFEDAIDNFSLVLSQDDACHEAYWGRALAKNGIIYVNDLLEDKKVPTCQRISDKNFLNDEDYLKAVELSDGAVRQNYVEQAQKIESIRKEWLEKASREKPYDIFICFKDSDRDNGLERTPDSYEAQNLYTHLTGLGYRVFFSRESLRDKVSEQYEPYIYAALMSARIMIVYGQRPEYFSSTWMKNEWSRYARMVANGDKHSNSLIVVYEKCNPSLLPSALKVRQCLDGGKKTFYGDLERHIAKIIEETTAAGGVEKIEIKRNAVAKKAKQVKLAAVNLKKIDNGDGYDLTLDEKKKMTAIERLIENEFFDKARALLDEVLATNPNNAKALTFLLFVKYRKKSVSEFMTVVNFEDFETADKIISCANKEYAESMLDVFYGLAKNLVSINEDAAAKLIDKILPYNYENRDANVARLMREAITRINPVIFEKVICGVDSKDVDAHVEYLYAFAKSALKARQFSLAKAYFLRVLKLDEGNVNCLRGIIRTTTLSDVPPEECRYGKEVALKDHFDFADFENLLKYLSVEQQKAEVIAVLDGMLGEESVTENMVEVFNHIIRYYPSDMIDLDEELSAMANRCLKCKFFDSAQYYLRLRMGANVETPDVYWNLIKTKAKVSTDAELADSPVKISEMPEFVNFLAVANEKQIQRCMALARKQEANLARKAQKSDPKLAAEAKGESKAQAYINSLNDTQKTKSNLIKTDKKLRLSVMFTLILPICLLVSYGVLLGCEFGSASVSAAYGAYVASIVFAVLSCVECVLVNPKVFDKIKFKRLALYKEKNVTASPNDYYYKSGLKKIRKTYSVLKTASFVFLIFVIVIMSVGASYTDNFAYSRYTDALSEQYDFQSEGAYYRYGYTDELRLVKVDADCNYIYSNVYVDGRVCSIMEIGDYALANSNVVGIEVNTKIRSVGKYAFKNCRNLSSVIFRGGENITLTKNIFGESNSWKNGYTVEVYGNNVEIDSGTFKNNTTIGTLKIHANGRIKIGSEAFKNSSIKSVILEAGVGGEIDNAAFEDSLVETFVINSPKLSFSIADEAFEDADYLYSFEIQNGNAVKSFGFAAFEGCNSLISLRISDANVKVALDCFVDWEAHQTLYLPKDASYDNLAKSCGNANVIRE